MVAERPSGRARLGRLRQSRVLKQGAGFALSGAGISVLAAISTALAARGLSTADFGSQSFAVSFLVFTSLLFDFGMFLPAARLSAQRAPGDRAPVVGGALLAFLPIGIAFCLLIFGLSYVVDSLFHVNAGSALRLISPLALVYPFQLLGTYLAQGVDRLHLFSITSLLGQALYVAPLAVLTVLDVKLTVNLVLGLRVAALAVASLLLVGLLRPVLRGARGIVSELTRAARAYGFQVYVGRVLSIATYNLDVLMLGALTDAKTVGFYVLAGSAAYVVGLPINGVSAALFARMTNARAIERRWLVAAWLTGLGGAALASILAYPLIPLVFSDRYKPAVALVLPLAFAEAIRGVTTVYNTYLSAQGRGRELRNAALVLTVSNVALNFALIPRFDAMGAAWASFVALVLNFGAHVVGYRRTQARRTEDEAAES